MTDNGVLFVQEKLPLHVEIEKPYRLKGEGDPSPENSGGSWGNLEKRWPRKSEIPVMKHSERVGTLTVKMDTVIKRDMIGREYIGKELSDWKLNLNE